MKPIRDPAAAAAFEAVELGTLGGAIGFNLRLAQNASFQAFCALTGDTGLRPGRYAVLQLIHDNPGISQTVLSRGVGSDKSTLTPILADLERRGLIMRDPDPNDRRGRRLSLTAAGKDQLATLAGWARRHDARLDAIVGLEGKQQLLRFLRMVIEGLNQNDRGPPMTDGEDPGDAAK
jgi:DNA-binding MarR family transcriptional regulator